MASNVSRTIPSVGYGLSNSLQNLAQAPLSARRDPTINDQVEDGTIWVNISTNSASIYTGTFLQGENNWVGIANYPLSVNSAAPTSANEVTFFSGAGDPAGTITFQGSLYLNVSGSNNATRAYIAIDDAGNFTNFVTAA